MLRRLFVIAFAFASCAPRASDAPTHDVVGQRAPIIQGIDDRKQWYEVEREDQRERMRLSVAAIVGIREPSDRSMTTEYELSGPTLEEIGFCADERFASERPAAACSATLVDDDVVLTAGHCLDDRPCEELAIVFDFYYSRSNVMATTRFAYPENVYYCRRIVHREHTAGSFTLADYGFIQLDRRATDDGREPAPLTTIDAPHPGHQVYTAGFPHGIPMKYSLSTIASFSPTTHYFMTGNDISGGNSGCGLFASYGALVGVLSYGLGDDTTTSPDSCEREVVIASATEYAGAFAAREAVRRLCATGWSSSRLCGTTTPYCGDRTCDEDENRDTCPDDCLAPVSWTCDDSYYGTADGCDCDCGSLDPDCSDSSQELFNCATDQVCDASGECEDIPVEVTPDAGVVLPDAGTSTAPRDAGVIHTRPDASAAPEEDAPEDDSGCAVAVRGRPSSGSWALILGLFVMLRLRKDARREAS
jgi:V8-like Glu-specific endopeptidase